MSDAVSWLRGCASNLKSTEIEVLPRQDPTEEEKKAYEHSFHAQEKITLTPSSAQNLSTYRISSMNQAHSLYCSPMLVCGLLAELEPLRRLKNAVNTHCYIPFQVWNERKYFDGSGLYLWQQTCLLRIHIRVGGRLTGAPFDCRCVNQKHAACVGPSIN